jgi:hypothetical protein
LIVAVVTLAWTGYVRDAYHVGILGDDSLQYHLPLAARFAQTGYVSRLNFVWLDPVTSFYPNNAELFHAVGMVSFGRDVLSPIINILWLLLAFLAAWVLGSPFGVGHLTIGMTALVLASPLTAASQSGSAMNDTAVIALVLASIALPAQGDRRFGVLAVAGAAAGLAVGTKLTAIAPVLAVTVGFLILRRNRRLRVVAVWAAGLAAGSGYWFVRNLVRTESPIPILRIPGFRSVRVPSIDAYGRTVGDYLYDGHFWRTVVPDGLRQVFGPPYPVVIVLVAVGFVLGIASLIRGREHGARALVASSERDLTVTLVTTGLIAGAAYVVTPASAYGPARNPYLFGASVRYAFPAALASLFLLALATVKWRRVSSGAITVIVLGVLAFELGSTFRDLPNPLWSRPRALVAAVVLWAVGTAVARRHGEIDPGKLRGTVAAAALAVIVVVAGYPVGNAYLRHRYTNTRLWAWARTAHHARIAVVGSAAQYPLTGLDLSNRVEYLGRRGRAGSFASYRDCPRFRSALRAGNYDYLVAGTEKWDLEPAPEQRWEAHDPAVTPILHDRREGLDSTLFRINRSGGTSTGVCE